MGISATSVVNYEAGTRKIPVELMLKFARFHGVSLDYLAGNSSEPEIDGCAAATAKYAQLWRDNLNDKQITSEEANQIFRFARFIINERNEND